MNISVVVPVYNVEPFIEECIESILVQCGQSDEIILVDDGATDNSGAICDRYASSYPQIIQVIHNENRGQMQSRCCGVRNATGDIILFVDSDDCLRTDAFEKIRQCFIAEQCDLLLFNGSRERDYGTPYLKLPFENARCYTGEEKKAVYEVMIVSSSLNSLCLKAVHRNVVMACIDKYPSFQGRNGEDLLLSIPLATLANKITYLAENLYYYRSRSGSVVHTYNPVRHKSIKAVHQEMETYIDRWGMPEMHPLHFAREVRGWGECLRQLLQNGAESNREQLLHELADDEYFRNAYQKMDVSGLAKRDVLLAKLLFQRRYGLLKLLGCVVRMKTKLLKLMKQQ